MFSPESLQLRTGTMTVFNRITLLLVSCYETHILRVFNHFTSPPEKNDSYFTVINPGKVRNVDFKITELYLR